MFASPYERLGEVGVTLLDRTGHMCKTVWNFTILLGFTHHHRMIRVSTQ